MYRRKSLILKIYKKVQRSKDTAFVLADFYTYCTNNDQILRALRKLVADKVLIRIGKGAYAKAKLSALTNDYVVSGGIIQAGRQAFFPSVFRPKSPRRTGYNPCKIACLEKTTSDNFGTL